VPLDPSDIEEIRRVFRRTGSVKATVRMTGRDRDTVRKYVEEPDDTATPPAPPPEPGCELPPAKHEGPELPPSFAKHVPPFVIDTPGTWGILCDPHVPYHDHETLRLFARECERRDVAGVLIDGDLLDCHETSRHDKDPTAPRYREEVEYGQRFLAWLRGRRPRSRLVFKFGNHDERAEHYVMKHAPAIYGMPGGEPGVVPGLRQVRGRGGEGPAGGPHRQAERRPRPRVPGRVGGPGQAALQQGPVGGPVRPPPPDRPSSPSWTSATGPRRRGRSGAPAS
jgi:hypothetical protein